MSRKKGSKNKVKPLSAPDAAAVALAQALGLYGAVQEEKEPGLPPDMHFREFLQLAKIRQKGSARLIRAVLNDEQEQVDEAFERGTLGLGPAHILGFKPRKIGLTTYFMLRFAHRFLTATDPVQLFHLANKDSTAAEIMVMHKLLVDNLPPEFRPKLPGRQMGKLVRPNGATIVVMTARTEGGGIRGLSPNWLHIAEFAHCRDPEELKATAIGALATEEGDRVFAESTPNHVGDVLHETLKEIQGGTSEIAWAPLLFFWHGHQSYRIAAPNLVRTPAEERMSEKFGGLDDQQLAFRRSKVGLMGERKTRREFPGSLEEGYSSQVGQWFQADQLEHVDSVEVSPEGTTILEAYDPRERYVAGGDCGAGVGGDHTTLAVLNVRTLRPAALYRSNTDTPQQSIDAEWHLLRMFGNAMVCIERNNWGIPHLNGLRALRANMYQEQSHETDGQRAAGEPRDFVTTTKSRLEVLEAFRARVLSGALCVVDTICYAEMRGAMVDKNGLIVFPRSKDGHGDVLMAYALAIRCAGHVAAPVQVPSEVQRELYRREMERRRSRSVSGAR
jgi:hypothetical protein